MVKIRPKGFLSGMNDKELLNYTFSLQGDDVTRGELSKKDGRLYNLLRERKLINSINSLSMRWQTYKEWHQYGLKNRYDKRNPISLSGSEDKEERSWYSKGGTMRKEGWLKKFPFKRLMRYRGYLINMGDRRLLDEVRSIYGSDITKGKLKEKDGSLYNELSKRELIYKIESVKTKSGKERRYRGFFSDKEDEELLNYTFSLYGDDVTIKELKEKDASLIIELRKRNLTNKLNRLRRQKGYLKIWNSFNKEMLEEIEKNNRDFPTCTQLRKTGKDRLVNSMYKDYGGKYAVMERIGYNERKIEELAGELEEIVREI